MTPAGIAASYLAGAIQPLEAALKILAAYAPLTSHPIWQATGGAHGPLSSLYAAADEVDRIGYIGSDPEWWHPDVRAVKQSDLVETQQRMQPRVAAACAAILQYEVGNHATDDPTSYARALRDAAAMLDLTPSMIRLHAGEMTAAEMRTVLAVLGWMRRELLDQACQPRRPVVLE